MTKQNWRLIGLAFAGVLLLIIFAQNLEPVPVAVLFFKSKGLPLAVMLIGTALVGYIGGLLTAGMARGKGKRGEEAAASKQDAKGK